MKTVQKLLYAATLTVAVCMTVPNLLAQNIDNDKPVLADIQEENTDITNRNNNQEEDTLWEKTKEVGNDAWEATKEGSAKAWEKTKEISNDAWEATKEGVAKAKDAVTN